MGPLPDNTPTILEQKMPFTDSVFSAAPVMTDNSTPNARRYNKIIDLLLGSLLETLFQEKRRANTDIKATTGIDKHEDLIYWGWWIDEENQSRLKGVEA